MHTFARSGFRRAVVCLGVVVVPVSILAEAPKVNAQDVPGSPMTVPAFGVPPKRGFLRFGIAEAGDFTATTERRAFARFDASMGFPYGLALHAGIPVIGDGTSVRAASAFGALDCTRTFYAGPFSLRAVIELGVVAPSLGARSWDAFDQHVAADKTSVWSGGDLVLQYRPLGLSLSAELTPLGATFLLGWQSSNARFAARAGLKPKTDAAPSQLLFEMSTAVSLDLWIGLFASAPITSPTMGPLVGLGMHWDIPLSDVTRSASAHGGPDMHALHGGEIGALEDAAVLGKITIVELGASWCPPCAAAESELLRRVRSDPELAVRSIDIDEAANLFDGRGAIPVFVVFDSPRPTHRRRDWKRLESNRSPRRGRPRIEMKVRATVQFARDVLFSKTTQVIFGSVRVLNAYREPQVLRQNDFAYCRVRGRRAGGAVFTVRPRAKSVTCEASERASSTSFVTSNAGTTRFAPRTTVLVVRIRAAPRAQRLNPRLPWAGPSRRKSARTTRWRGRSDASPPRKPASTSIALCALRRTMMRDASDSFATARARLSRWSGGVAKRPGKGSALLRLQRILSHLGVPIEPMPARARDPTGQTAFGKGAV